MGRMDYLAMKTDAVAEDPITFDMNELKLAAIKLISDVTKLGVGGLALIGTSFLKGVASFSAFYLLFLCRIGRGPKVWTTLLVAYIFFSLHSGAFNFIRGEFGKWNALITVVGTVFMGFFPRRQSYPGCSPGTVFVVHVVAPDLFARTLKESVVGVFACLIIARYLLLQHIRASGGFKSSFTQRYGISNTIAILLLLLYPLSVLMLYFL